MCACAAQLLERVILGVCNKHNTEPGNPSVGVVRLSGVLHCDERSAFQEVARQLCRCGRACVSHMPFSCWSALLCGLCVPKTYLLLLCMFVISSPCPPVHLTSYLCTRR